MKTFMALALILAFALSLLFAGCGGMSDAELRQIQADQAKTEADMNTQQAVKLAADAAKVEAETQQTQVATNALAAMPDGPAKWSAAARSMGFERTDEQFYVNGSLSSSVHYIKGDWRDPPKPPRRKDCPSYNSDNFCLDTGDDVVHTEFSMGPVSGQCDLTCDPDSNQLTVERSGGELGYGSSFKFKNYDEFAKFVAQAEAMERAWRALK